MKRKIVLLLIICFTAISLFCFGKHIKEKDLIMPKKLNFSSLPDDYDKRIEPFFTYYYQFLKVQDVKADPNIIIRKAYDFMDSLKIDECKSILTAMWLLQNKYPEYFAEYVLLNKPLIPRPNNESKIHVESITSYLLKRYGSFDAPNNYETINGFFVSIKARSLHNHNLIGYPLSKIYIVGKVKSFVPAYRRDKIIGYKLTVDVLSSFGGNYFPLESVVVKFFGSKQTLDSIDLNSEYVMAIHREYDELAGKLDKDIFIYSVDYSEMKKIENNMITRSDNISYKNFLYKSTHFVYSSKDGDLSYFFTNDEQQLSLTKFDEILEKYKNFEFRSNQSKK